MDRSQRRRQHRKRGHRRVAHVRRHSLPIAGGLPDHARRVHVGSASSEKLLHAESGDGRPAFVLQHA